MTNFVITVVSVVSLFCIGRVLLVRFFDGLSSIKSFSCQYYYQQYFQPDDCVTVQVRITLPPAGMVVSFCFQFCFVQNKDIKKTIEQLQTKQSDRSTRHLERTHINDSTPYTLLKILNIIVTIQTDKKHEQSERADTNIFCWNQIVDVVVTQCVT